MKTMQQLTNRALQTAETSLSSEAKEQEPTPPQSLPDGTERERPLRTRWQRKWLDLEVFDPEVQILADAISDFASRWFKESPGPRLLVIYGQTGCGKTRVAKRLHGWAQAVAFTRFCELKLSTSHVPGVQCADWGSIATRERMDEKEFMLWLSEAGGESLLIIDDIGTETDPFKSGVPTQRLCDVLNKRAGKFTLITTNVPAESWSERWDSRVSDRLLRSSTIISLKLPSYALIKP